MTRDSALDSTRDLSNDSVRYVAQDSTQDVAREAQSQARDSVQDLARNATKDSTDSVQDSTRNLDYLAQDSTQDSANSMESQTQDYSDLSRADSTDTAQDSSDYSDLEAVDLGTSTVTLTKSPQKAALEVYQSGDVINRTMLETNPTGNGDIGSILRILPNVQFDNTQLRSTTPGEIDPADVSISGGLYYQNNFQLDGFNMNNDLDPANSNAQGSFWRDFQSIIGGNSQGLNVDTSILDSVSVQDSNISAAYGGFTGGVVEATTKRATKAFGGNISYQVTQGNADPSKTSLTQYHIYAPTSKEYEEFLNSTSANNQPEFIKHFIRASLESKFSQNGGIIASFTTTQSFIPLTAYETSQIGYTTDSTRKVQKRQSYNFFIKGHYDIGENLRLEGSYAYMPQFNEYFVVNIKDSDLAMQSGGHQVGAKVIWDNSLGILTMQGNFNFIEGSRTNAKDYLKNWLYSEDKNWNTGYKSSGKTLQREGSYGNAFQRQISFNAKIVQDFTSLTLGLWENSFQGGLEIVHTKAYYKREKDAIYASTGNNTWQPLTAGQTCTDLEWCSNGIVDINMINSTGAARTLRTRFMDNNGQWIAMVNLLKAATINARNTALGFFLEDSMNFDFGDGGDINARFGARLDNDTYMEKSTIAPRFSINYEFPWNKWAYGKNFSTKITGGANRYYGRNLYAYKLNATRESFVCNNIARSAETVSWYDIEITCNDTKTDFKKLKVPYNDEFTGGISQQFYVFDISAKYIHRFGRDEIVGSCAEYSASGNCTITTYDNTGKSQSGVISVSIQNNRPIKTFGITHNYILAFDWTNVERSYGDYTDYIGSESDADRWISYNGKLIRFSERPADNYIRPYTLRFDTMHSFEAWNTKWVWNNFFRFRSGYDIIVEDTSGTYDERYNFTPNQDWHYVDGVYQQVETWRSTRIPWSFSWDMRIGVEFPHTKTSAVYVNLDIYNVLGRKNLTTATGSISDGSGGRITTVPVYEVGRQFWIQIGYKF